MKQKTNLIFLIAMYTFNVATIYALTPPGSSSSASGQILLSQQLPPSLIQGAKNLNGTVLPYPFRTVRDDGMIQQGILNRTIKAMTPAKAIPILQNGRFSVLRAKPYAFKNYPGGSAIFPKYPKLSGKFDAMITDFQQNPHFIPFFRKVHINALNQLYHYLMGIYVNFNLQHTGIVQAQNGNTQVSIPDFMTYEASYHANKKTLIINHLMNLIESQFNSAIRSYMTKMPQMYASFTGNILVHNDYSIDLTQFLDKEIVQGSNQTDAEKSSYNQVLSSYLQGLAKYLDFFQAYTGYLHTPHPKKERHFTAFVDISEQINQFLYGDVDALQDKWTIAVAKMNPPLFTTNYDDIRALKIIPHLAKSLPKNSKKVMWPEHMVQAANEGVILHTGSGSNPIAYFRTKEGIVVKNNNNNRDSKLYMCMRSGCNLFEEELIAQPDWLNSWEGVSKILSACFGDFSALLGLEILDPCMESLIKRVVDTQQGKDDGAAICSEKCQALMNSWKKEKTVIQAPPGVSSSIPSLSNMPDMDGENNNSMPSMPSVTSPVLAQQP